MRTRRSISSRITRRAFVALVLGMATLPALAAYPERPITVSLPVGPGVVVEGLLRAICEEASKILGQPIVVENKTGAMQRLPALAVRKAAPDGYTLAVATETVHVSQPIIDSTFSMRPGKDFEPVAALFSLPLILVSHPSAPYQDFKGMVAYAKANPGKINFAVPNGSTPHFAALLLQDVLGIKVSIVPYKDQSSSLADLYTGRVDMTVSGFTVKEAVDTGKLRPLAVTTAARWTAFPSVPTLTELGVDIDVSAWFSLLAPPGTPQEVITKLHAAFNEAMKSAPVVRRFSEVHMSPLGGGQLTPKQLVEMVDVQVKVWTPVLRNAGVKLQ